MNKKLLPWLITFCALGLGGTAAYYSIIGLSKLFAGAATAVIIMASFLEISKLTLATYLHSYWVQLGKLSKLYYTTSVVILSFITSIGIYGMLSHGYQETASKSGTIDAQVALVETKRDNIKEQLNVYVGEKETINKAVGDLRSGLSNNVIQYTNSEGVLVTTTSSATRKSLEKQLDQSLERQNIINAKVDDLNTKLFEYETEIVEISTNNELAGELGPLKYLSGLTGVSMDKIINILLLVIIFVFDPLAIALVISANYAFEQLKRKTKENLYGEIIPVEAQVEDIEKIVEPYDTPQDEINDWNNTLQDGLDNIPYEESEEYKRKIEKENELLTTSSVSGWRKKKILKERKKRDDDGLSKVY
jgi:cell division protein FtsB